MTMWMDIDLRWVGKDVESIMWIHVVGAGNTQHIPRKTMVHALPYGWCPAQNALQAEPDARAASLWASPWTVDWSHQSDTAPSSIAPLKARKKLIKMRKSQKFGTAKTPSLHLPLRHTILGLKTWQKKVTICQNPAEMPVESNKFLCGHASCHLPGTKVRWDGGQFKPETMEVSSYRKMGVPLPLAGWLIFHGTSQSKTEVF